jgi:hypothetical protein
MIDEDTKKLMRALIYPVQFEKDPKNGIERVMSRNRSSSLPSQCRNARTMYHRHGLQ